MKQVFDKQGRPVTIDGDIVPDGCVVKVPMVMMDATPPDIIAITRQALADAQPLHRPGALPLSDATMSDREAAIAARNKRLTESWRNPPVAHVVKRDGGMVVQIKDVATAIANRNRRLENSWRGGAA